MLKIVSDPSTLPVYEVDFADGFRLLRSVATLGSNPVRNVRYEQPDGSANIMAYPIRNDLQVEIAEVTEKTLDHLQRMIDLGVPVYVLPNFDSTTRFYCPLAGGIRAKARLSNKRVMTDVDGVYTRPISGYALSEKGILETRGIDVPAFFFTHDLGYAPRFELMKPNLYNSTLASSGGNLIISDNAAEQGPLEFSIGSTQLQNMGASSLYAYAVANSADAGTGNWYQFSIWAKGRSSFRLEVLNGATVITSPLYTLTNTWARYDFMFQKPESTTNIEHRIRVDGQISNNVMFVDAEILVIHGSSKGATREYNANAAGSTEGDSLLLYSGLNTAGVLFNMAWTGFIPQEDANVGLWEIDDAVDDTYAAFIIDDGLNVRVGGIGLILDITTDWASIAGKRYYANVRYLPSPRGGDEPGITISMRVEGESTWRRIVKADAAVGLFQGTQIRIGSTSTIPSPAIQPSGDATIQHVRHDEGAMTNEEIEFHSRLFMPGAYRELFKSAQGRTYALAGMSPVPIEGSWDLWNVGLKFEELVADPHHTIIGG